MLRIFIDEIHFSNFLNLLIFELIAVIGIMVNFLLFYPSIFADPIMNQVYQLVIYLTALAFMIFEFQKRKINLLSVFLKSSPRSLISPVFLMAIAIYIFFFSTAVFSSVNFTLSKVFQNSNFFLFSYDYFTSMGGSKFFLGSLTLSFTILVMVAPIVEELLFRGFVLNRLLAITSPKMAVVLSSALFGILHQNFVAMFGAGIVLSLL